MHATGRFKVRGSANVLARILARAGGLPRRGEVAMELAVTPDAAGETWRRTFGGQDLTTRQWEEGGLLVEEIGLMQIEFALTAADGALGFRQVGARVGRGRRHVRLPRWLAPAVTARAWSDDGLRVEVEIRFPAAGLLCAYEGVLRKDAPR